jgi:hypothetical protein
LGQALVFILVGVIIVGIVEGKSYDFWVGSVEPWLTTEASITQGSLLMGVVFCILGWICVLVAAGFGFLFYGADRRRLGQLEEVGKENAEREQAIHELHNQLGQLKTELNLVQQVNTELLALFSAADRELLTLLTQDNLHDKNAIRAYFESVCRRLFKYLRRESEHLFRASIYLPSSQEKEYLIIAWDIGVGEVSRRWNKWYIGEHDPSTLGVHRGIPGTVYMNGKDLVSGNVKNEPGFHDPHEPPRSVLPYKALLSVLIHPNDTDRKCGVLCIDSQTYTFDTNDLKIAQQVAVRLGWVLHQSNSYDNVVV